MSRVIDAELRLTDKFSTPLTNSIKSLTAATKAGQKARKQIAAAGKEITKIGEKMTASVSVPIVTAFTASAKAASDFQTSMAKVQTIADTSQVSMSDLQKQIMAVSNETGVASTDIAESTYSAISAGQSTKDAVDAVSQSIKLAKAGFTDSAVAMDTLTTIQNAYGKSVGSFEQISDKLIVAQNLGKTTVAELGSSMGKVIPTASMYGVSLDNLASAYVATTKNGIATAESTTYINGMLNELGKSGSTASKTLKEKTGKSFAELMKSGDTLTDVIQVLQDAADKSGKSIADMFSSQEAGKAAATLSQHGKDFDDAMKSMADSAGTLKTAYATVDDTPAEKLQKTLNLVKNDMIVLGNSVLTVLQPAIEKVTGVVQDLSDKFQALSPEQRDMIVKIGLMVAAVGPAVTMFGKLVTTSVGVFDAIAKVRAAGGLLKGAFTACTSPAGVVIAALAGIVAVGILVWKNWDTVKEKCAPLVQSFESVKSTLSDVAGTIKESMSKISDAVSPILGPLADKAMGAAVTLGQTVGKAVEKIAPHFQKLVEAVTPVLGFLAGTFLRGITAAVEVISKVLSTKIDVISDVVGGVIDVISGVLSFVTDVFKGDWDAAWGDVQGIFSDAWGAISSVAQDVLGIFPGISDALTPVADAVSGAFGSIGSAVSGAFSTISSTIEPVLGPLASTAMSVFSTVGQNIISTVQQIAPHFAPLVSAVSGAVSAIGTLLSNIITAAAPVVGFIGGAFLSGITGALQGVGEVFSGVFETVGTLISGAIDTLTGLITFLTDVFEGDWEGAWNDICNVFSGIVDTITGIVDNLKTIFGGVVDTIKGAVDGVKDFITGADSAKKESSSSGSTAKKTTSGTKKAGKNATGTASWRGGLTYVGESGKELVDIPKGSRIYSHQQTAQIEKAQGETRQQAAPVTVSGGTTITIPKLADQIVVREDADIERIAQALARQMRQAMGMMGGVSSADMA